MKDHLSYKRIGKQSGMGRRVFLAHGLRVTGGLVVASQLGCTGDILEPMLEPKVPKFLSVTSDPSGFIYDPAEGLPEEQGFTVKGDGGHVVVNRPEGPRLEVDGTARPRFFSQVDPKIPSSAIHLEARIGAIWINAAEGDSGVGFEIDEGPGGKRIWVSCVQERGQPRMRLDYLGAPTLAGNWTGAEVVLRFGRTADGGAYLEVPGVGRSETYRRNLPDAQASAPHYAFGCFFKLPSVQGWFGPIRQVAHAGYLEVTNIELQPNAANRVKIEGTFNTDIDPEDTDILQVGLRCYMDDSRIYPTTTADFMPVEMRRDGDKWVITKAARHATGIQALELVHTGGGDITFHLNDARTDLGVAEYLEVVVHIELHLDDGTLVHAEQTVSLFKSDQTFNGPV
jgi:hypothetical protein